MLNLHLPGEVELPSGPRLLQPGCAVLGLGCDEWGTEGIWEWGGRDMQEGAQGFSSVTVCAPLGFLDVQSVFSPVDCQGSQILVDHS
jgi:hypothetical protein